MVQRLNPRFLWLLTTGDIAFRFLDYVHQQQKRRRRKEDVGSWSDVSDSYSSGAEALGSGLPGQSRAVVCDINQEMLRVGQERSENLDLRAGGIKKGREKGSHHLLNLTLHFPLLQVCLGWWVMQKSFPLMTTSLISTPSLSGSGTSRTWTKWVTSSGGFG